jgi:hypothetical protein
MATFISLVIVFILGLLGALFRCVKEKDGKPEVSKYGFPLPTKAGWFIIGFLSLSFLLSVWITYESKQQADKDKKEAEQRQAFLQGLIEEIQGQNNLLIGQNDLLKTEVLNAKQDTIEGFKGILTRQERLATDTVKNINRVLNEFGGDLAVYLRVKIPASQDIVRAYTSRLESQAGQPISHLDINPSDDTWPASSGKEFEIAGFFANASASLYFYKNPLTLADFKRGGRQPDLILLSGFNLMADQSKIGSTVSRVSYKTNELDIFVFNGSPVILPGRGRIRSIDDLPGSTVIITIHDSSEKLNLNIDYLITLTRKSRPVVARGFRFGYRNAKDVIFIGTIPPNQ